MYDVKACQCNGDGPELVYLSGLRDPAPLMYGDEDRRAMDETNWVAIVSGLGESEWHAPRATWSTHWDDAPAWITGHDSWDRDDCHTCIHVRAGDEDAVTTLEQLAGRLDDYPLLDEDAYSAREWDAWVTYWDDFGFRDFVIDIHEDRGEADDVLDLPDDMLADLSYAVQQGMCYYSGFSGEYDERGARDALETWEREVRWLADEDRRTLGGRQVELFDTGTGR